jgi:hypothetical protein
MKKGELGPNDHDSRLGFSIVHFPFSISKVAECRGFAPHSP